MAGAELPELPTIGDLPDAILRSGLELVGQDEGPALTLVCRRWRAAFWSHPPLWCSFVAWRSGRLRFGPCAGEDGIRAWLEAKLAALGRVAPHVEAATLLLGGPQHGAVAALTSTHVPAFLRLLQPAAQAGRLTALALNAHTLPECSVPALALLSSLRSLLASAQQVPAPLAEAGTPLPALTRLELASGGGLPDAHLACLTRLSCLQELEVTAVSGRPSLPATARFPRQRRYLCSVAEGGVQVGGAEIAACSYSEQPEQEGGGSSSSSPAAAGTLWVDCASHGGGDLAPLLRALLPGGAAPLRTLRLWSCWLDAPRCGPLPELAGLRSLVIAAAPGAELLPPSLVHSLLEQAPGLESLEVYGVEEEEAPLPAVAQLRRLTRLEWNGRRAALPGQPAPRADPRLAIMWLTAQGLVPLAGGAA